MSPSLLIGLGNPGKSYAGNRHNVGFMAVQEIAENYDFGAWKKSFGGMVSEGKIGSDKIYLFMPLGYMNNSGMPAAEIAGFYKIPLEKIWVLHDELDLPLGKLRVKRGGGAGGHNGLKSMDAQLGPGYGRVRIGIDHPGDKDLVSDYVLCDFAKSETKLADLMLNEITRHIALLLKGDEAGFMSKIALATQPTKEGKKP